MFRRRQYSIAMQTFKFVQNNEDKRSSSLVNWLLHAFDQL